MAETSKTLRLCVAAFFVMIALVLGALLRVGSMDDLLWLDELHTAWCVHESLADVASRATMGNQSPLYFWLEFAAFHSCGKNETALRLPSLLAGLLLMPSIGWVVYRIGRSWTGVWLAVFLAAIEDQFLFYGVEARPRHADVPVRRHIMGGDKHVADIFGYLRKVVNTAFLGDFIHQRMAVEASFTGDLFKIRVYFQQFIVVHDAVGQR